jgi:hypothetical protein
LQKSISIAMSKKFNQDKFNNINNNLNFYTP